MLLVNTIGISAFLYGRWVCAVRKRILRGYVIAYISCLLILVLSDLYFAGMTGSNLFYFPLIATAFTIVKLENKRILYALIILPVLFFVISLALFKWSYSQPTMLTDFKYPGLYLNAWINVAVMIVAITFYFLSINLSNERDLNESKKLAENTANAKSEFLSTMSHEIRTPLNAVVGLTHLLQVNSPRDDQREYLESLSFSADHLLGLINDILDFNKIQAGKLELEKNAINLKSFLKGIYQVFEFKANEKGIRLDFYIPEGIPEFVETDSHRLAQVINNLLSNAVKFTEKGCIRLHLELIKSKSEIHKVRFIIEDSGIGIDQTNLEKIFQKFTQAKSDTTRKFGGTGLGLNIVDGLLKQFKSHLIISSALGKGTTFSFTLDMDKPAEVQEHLLKQDSVHLAQINFENRNILLVEDFPVNTMVARNLLESKNAIVSIAINGREAVEMFKKRGFDCILMDLQMPVMNGFQATEEIRFIEKNKCLKHTPIIALTASALFDVKDDALKAGMDDYISKPFNPKEFYSKIFLSIEKKENSTHFFNRNIQSPLIFQ